jgi:hypothetical protein
MRVFAVDDFPRAQIRKPEGSITYNVRISKDYGVHPKMVLADDPGDTGTLGCCPYFRYLFDNLINQISSSSFRFIFTNQNTPLYVSGKGAHGEAWRMCTSLPPPNSSRMSRLWHCTHFFSVV